MVIGKTCQDLSIIFTFIKKHYCIHCGSKLLVIKESKIVNARWAKKNLNITTISGAVYAKDDEIEIIRYKFRCPNCKTEYSIEEMRDLEK